MAFDYNCCGIDNNKFYATNHIVIYWFQREEQGGLSVDNYCQVLQIRWCLSGHWSYSRGLLNVRDDINISESLLGGHVTAGYNNRVSETIPKADSVIGFTPDSLKVTVEKRRATLNIVLYIEGHPLQCFQWTQNHIQLVTSDASCAPQ